MRRLRLAYLPPSLRPGGAEKQMLELAERLPRDRFQVDFVLISGSGEYDGRALAAGARLRTVGSAPPRDAGPLARMARRTTKMLRYASNARREHYDIVDAWLYPADVMAALMRPMTRTPVVVAGRRNLGDFEGTAGPLEQRVAALANRMVDAVVANSGAVAVDTVRRGHIDPAKVRTIRNGVALIEPASADERSSRRQRFGATNEDTVIGCVANYRPVKRLDLLIDAFAPLARENAHVLLVLVGEGESRRELQEQIDRLGLEGRVRLHGAESDPKPLCAVFDVVVQSSRSEGLPNAMLEAAAAGRPIVATAAGGTSEIVIDGRTGLLVPVNDPAALTAALRRLIEDPPLCTRLGASARDHVATVFGMDRFVAEFAALYEELAAAKHVVL